MSKINEMEMSIHELPMKVNVVIDHAGKLASNIEAMLQTSIDTPIKSIVGVLGDAENHITEIREWIINVKEEVEKVRKIFKELIAVQFKEGEND